MYNAKGPNGQAILLYVPRLSLLAQGALEAVLPLPQCMSLPGWALQCLAELARALTVWVARCPATPPVPACLQCPHC